MKTFAVVQERTRGKDAWDGRGHLVASPYRKGAGYVCGIRPAKGPVLWREPVEVDAGAVKLCGNCVRRGPATFRLLGSDAVRGRGA
jgi:hypothetical protein